MAHSLPAPFPLRARRAAALLLPVVLLAAVGCGGHHKRSSLRPVYLAPRAGCPTGNCGGAGVVVPSGPASLSPAPPPTTSSEPALVEPGSSAGASVTDAPAPSGPAPSARPIVPPSGSGGPALQGPLPEEPGLEPAGAGTGPGAAERRPSAAPAPRDSKVSPGTSLLAPGAPLRSTTGRRPATGRTRQASLSEELRPFVNDPDDLFSPPKADRPWKYIVLHHSASPSGGYDSIDREHRTRLGWQGCGYHFVIGNGTESPDGRIEVARRWTDQKNGVHCRDGKNSEVNEYGIGICLVGDLEKAPPTERQVAAARALVAYLGNRYKIAADHTETHAHLAASPTSCPGRLFPAQAILGPSGPTLR